MPGNPVTNLFGCGFVKCLRSPWGSVDVAVSACLIALAANIDLKGLQSAAVNRQITIGQYFLKAVHCINFS